jgi:hypothetical protein
MAEPRMKVKGMRQFMVFTLPHRRDPELKTPVIELDAETGAPIEYENTEVIEQVILNLARQRARSAGYNAGAQAVLDAYGFTITDYLAKRKENKEKKVLDKGEPQQ